MENKKKTKRSFLDDNRIVLAMSIVIAVVAWIIVAGFIKPNEDASINNVPINFVTNSANYKNLDLEIVGEQRVTTARVDIKGDGGIISELGNTDVTVFCDYNNVSGPGTYEIPLKAEKVTSGNYQIVEVFPKTIEVTFETVTSSKFTLSVSADEITAEDGFYRGTPVATPLQVDVRGPISEMANVAGAVVIIPDTAQRSTTYTVSDADVLLVDADDNIIQSSMITIEPATVTVEIPVLPVKELPLTVNVIGAPAGFDVTWFESLLSYSRDTIRVAGSEALLATKTEISVGSVDVSSFGLNDERETLEVRLEDGLRNLDNIRQLEVSLDTSTLGSKTLEIPIQDVVVENVPLGLTVQPAGRNGSMEVALVGPRESIAAVLPENVTVEIEASGVKIEDGGQQELAVRVYVARNRRIYAIGEYTLLCDVGLE